MHLRSHTWHRCATGPVCGAGAQHHDLKQSLGHGRRTSMLVNASDDHQYGACFGSDRRRCAGLNWTLAKRSPYSQLFGGAAVCTPARVPVASHWWCASPGSVAGSERGIPLACLQRHSVRRASGTRVGRGLTAPGLGPRWANRSPRSRPRARNWRARLHPAPWAARRARAAQST